MSLNNDAEESIKDKHHKYITACSNGDINLVKQMISRENKKFKSVKLLSDCLLAVCKAGHSEILKVLLQYKTKLWDCVVRHPYYGHILYCACKSENINTIEIISELLVCAHGAAQLIRDWVYGLAGILESGNMYLFTYYMNLRKHDPEDWDTYLQCACKSGDINLVQYVIEKSGIKNLDWNRGLKAACTSENIDIVIMMIDKGANNWNKGLKGACISGNIYIVKYILLKCEDEDKSFCFWNKGLQGACKGGHINIFKDMIKRGANAWGKFYNIFEGGHMDILKLILLYDEYDDNYTFRAGIDMNEILWLACCFGNLEIAKLVINKGANNWNEGLLGACGKGHVDLVKLMLYHGATNFNNAMVENVTNNTDIDIINILIKEGANNFSCLRTVENIHLYTLYIKFNGSNTLVDTKYLQLLHEHPPYVLFIGAACSKTTNCLLTKIPVELFRLLFKY